MGMAMGAFLFAIASLRWAVLAGTARHCAVLGLIFVPPTIILGVLDWQHYYDGDWSGLFNTKIALAILLPLLLLAAIKTSSGGHDNFRLSIVLYALGLLTAIALGFVGGQIQYG